MLRELTDLIAWLILPPAGLLLAILIGLALYLRGRRRLGLAVSLAAFSLLWIASLGVVGRSLAAMVELPAARPADLAGAQAIVVLGAGRILDAPEYGEDIVGGEGLVRLRYAARVARATSLPVLVAGGKPYGGTLSEGETMARVLQIDFGMPVRWIEDQSTTTAENAARAFAILKPEGRTRIVLVTSALHIRRSQLAFVKAGFDVLPAPTNFAPRGAPHLLDWLPSSSGLGGTRLALWEILGIAWYRLRGVG